MFYRMQLRLKINQHSIIIQFGGLVNRVVNWDDVSEYKIIDYGFVGGWGIRCSSKYGKIYSTGGSKGLFILTKNREKFVVGTKKPKESSMFIDQLSFDRKDPNQS